MKTTILVVDDERAVADTTAAILNSVGYDTMTAYSAIEALDLLRITKPALVLTDVIMPGMNGVDLAIEVSKLRPGLKILLISGNAATQEMVHTARVNGYAFPLIAKPVPPRELLTLLESMLKGMTTVCVQAMSLVHMLF